MNDGAGFKQLISAESDLFGLLHRIQSLCSRHHMTEFNCSRIKTIASELSQNILKYADLGKVDVKLKQEPGRIACYMHFSDQGPGIDDLQLAMKNSFSSSGSLGFGLPGVERMADAFTIESIPGQGTQIGIIVYQHDKR